MPSSETILITGGAGNLARQLAGAMAERAGRIVLLDVATTLPAGLPAGCTYVAGDVGDAAGLRDLFVRESPRTVIHFASLLSGSSEDDRPRAWRVNMDGAFAVFEASLAAGTERLFFPSSVAAYGAPLPETVPLDQPQWPTGLYGVTKTAIERLGVYYHQRHGLDFRCLRLPVVVSRDAPPGAASAYASRAFVESVRQGGYTFRVAPHVRPSLIYVKDVLQAITRLLAAPAERLSRRVYNVQALSPTAEELAAAITRRLPDTRLRFEPDPETTALIANWPVAFDDTAARNDWGWSPRYGLDELADDFLAELQATR